jgi:Icc-related predicted phosphoesterase
MLYILHTSDTHGWDITQIPLDAQNSEHGVRIDVVVHSGDFQPTKGRRVGERIRPVAEVRYQDRWMRKNAPKIAAWLDGRPFVFVPGNHDFYNPTADLALAGANVVWLRNGSASVAGIRFSGYRFIPYIEGEWCGELPESDIAKHAKEIEDCDVLVTHAPPHGVLDRDSGRHFGSSALANEYLYNREGRRLPKVWLCGHVHPHGGEQAQLTFGGILVVNSAKTWQVIGIKPSEVAP